MKQRDDILGTLREARSLFERDGVASLYLFGSFARNEASDSSDVDLFFDLGRPEGFTLYHLAALKEQCEALTGRAVDIMSRGAIHPRMRSAIEAEALRIF